MKEHYFDAFKLISKYDAIGEGIPPQDAAAREA